MQTVLGVAIRDIEKGAYVILGADIISEEDYENLKREGNMESNGRGLFEIVAIEINTGTIVYEDKVIAEGEKEAMFESNLKEILIAKKLTRDDIHVLVREFGKVPAKVQLKRFKVISKVGKTLLAREEK